MRLGIPVLAISTFLFAGCVVPNDSRLDINVNQAIGERYVGKPFVEMLMHYGAPLHDTEIQGVKVYSWSIERTEYPQYSAPYVLRCQLDAYVRDDATVSVGIKGNQGACVEFL